MPTKQRTRRRGLKGRRQQRRTRKQRGGQTPFDLNAWRSAVSEHMKSLTAATIIDDLRQPQLAIPADADRAFLDDAARVRAALILVVMRMKDDIIDYDGPIATVFANFCANTDGAEVAYLNTVENRLRGSEMTVNICDVTSYPLYIWYVAANTPDIPVAVDFMSDAAVQAPVVA